MEEDVKNETEKRERKTPTYLREYDTSGIKDEVGLKKHSKTKKYFICVKNNKLKEQNQQETFFEWKRNVEYTIRKPMEKDLCTDFTVVFGITPLIFYDSLLRVMEL